MLRGVARRARGKMFREWATAGATENATTYHERSRPDALDELMAESREPLLPYVRHGGGRRADSERKMIQVGDMSSAIPSSPPKTVSV